MENIIFLKIEIIVLIISLTYILYFIWDKLVEIYYNLKKIVTPKKVKRKTWIKKIDIKSKENNYKKEKNLSTLTKENKEKLANIVKRVKNNSSKWYIDVARALIVEWLAIDKYNKDLNLELAKLYEKEKKYKNAEYIYNDILENIKDSIVILKRLWFVLAVQKKYKKSIKTYEKVYKKNKTDVEVIDMLGNINYEVGDYEKALEYIKLWLRDKPRNAEKLIMSWVCYEKLWEIENAIFRYKKVLEIQPYNTEILDKVKALEK